MPRTAAEQIKVEAPSEPLPSPAVESQDLRMSYRIGRGETGVLTFQPYKSYLLPLWRFRTPAIAEQSSRVLWDQFVRYGEQGDFVGMDMARKFIQMGMTRAKRYANHKGGRKYEQSAGDEQGKRKELPKSGDHKDKEEKEESSRIFKAVWERCRKDDEYQRLKEEFQKEQKEWDKAHKGQEVKKQDPSSNVKMEHSEPKIKAEAD